MVCINLAPRLLLEAWKTRARVTRALRGTSAALGVLLILVTSNYCIAWRDEKWRASKRHLVDLDVIQKAIETGRRDVEQERARARRLQKLQEGRFFVTRYLRDISEIVPAGVTLSSLRVSDDELECAGVAKDRRSIGEFASNIGRYNGSGSVRVTKLETAAVGRQVLHDFVIRGEKSKIAADGIGSPMERGNDG